MWADAPLFNIKNIACSFHQSPSGEGECQCGIGNVFSFSKCRSIICWIPVSVMLLLYLLSKLVSMGFPHRKRAVFRLFCKVIDFDFDGLISCQSIFIFPRKIVLYSFSVIASTRVISEYFSSSSPFLPIACVVSFKAH